MNTRAVRFYGDYLAMETFALPELKEDEILASVVADTLCFSTHKAILQGAKHVRVPSDVADNPVMIGHEFSGLILAVGPRWAERFTVGQKYAIQPAIEMPNGPFTPGYSFPYIGGSATAIVIPREVMEQECLIPLAPETPHYGGCLAEPLSCVVGAFNRMYHLKGDSVKTGIRPNGNMLLLGGAGPMGMSTVEYSLHLIERPRRIVVVDNVQDKIDYGRRVVCEERAAKAGIELTYVNSARLPDPEGHLRGIARGEGYDDIFVYAAARQLIELGDHLLARDGCMNLFAGPASKDFAAQVNFYNVHYRDTHFVGISGGTKGDMDRYFELLRRGAMDPAPLITHIGGLNCVIDSIERLPELPGGKKLIYTHIDLPLTTLGELGARAKEYPFCGPLDEIVRANGGMWCGRAEAYLLEQING